MGWGGVEIGVGLTTGSRMKHLPPWSLQISQGTQEVATIISLILQMRKLKLPETELHSALSDLEPASLTLTLKDAQIAGIHLALKQKANS